LDTDASHYALGCVLSQRNELGKLHPVGYYSRSFTKAERNYSIRDKELFVIITSLEEWKHLLTGVKEPLKIFTDHRNLLFACKSQIKDKYEPSALAGKFCHITTTKLFIDQDPRT